MNSNFNKFDFDLGIGSNSKSSKPLNEQKNKPNNSYTYSYSSSTSSFPGSGPKTTPSWTHQPAPSQLGVTRSELGGPASMVGDITGKSWNSTAAPPSVAVASSIGIVNKNPYLFGDLLNSALGGNKGGSNVPLKNVTPAKSSFSMGGMGDSLPKTSSVGGSGIGGNNSGRTGGGASWSSFQSSGTGTASMNKGSGLGMGSGSGISGQLLRTGGGGVSMSSNKDPFGSLGNFSSKPMKNSAVGGSTGIGSAGKSASGSSGNFNFGDFQNSSKSNQSTFSSGSNAESVPKMGSFGTQNQSAPVQSTGADSFDFFISSGSATSGGANVQSQEFSGGDDFGLDSSFGGGHDEGTTTELDGLPPAPAGVSASAAKTKGLDNYKQGQYADAIKWLSWAESLLEKAGETAGTMEVLSCRASCYKEVGEYKKAVADCTKVLDRDEKNVAVLVQRALLYESMEKYRLGADDLRTVMKIDPGNRVARSTIHRLTKMADQ